jgi:hypothetical protein
MPTRLLRVEHLPGHRYPRLQLCETHGHDSARYAALSYCWGGEQPAKTTSENIYRHLIRLNYTELPATIQDAITVTTRLGLRYLWVDSLCIVQNDSRDKAYEIGQMPFIYSRATVTISASRAMSVREGFLHARSRKGANTRLSWFPYLCNNGELTSINFVPEVVAEPLSSRGWALQERLLSSRVTEYGSFQTRWICMHDDGYQTDGLSQDRTKSDRAFRQTLIVIQRDETSFGGPNIEDASRISGLEVWRDILKRYTQRALTLSTDHLPAISGVAARFSRILADEYCAGFWKSVLAVELLWAVLDTKLALRPVEYQGPSWSWAATNQSITFLAKEYHHSVDAHFSILDVKIQPVKSDLDRFAARFGAVESGRLMLKGTLGSDLWMYCVKSAHIKQWKVRQRNTLEDQSLSINIILDAIEDEFVHAGDACVPVFFLKILEVRVYGSGTLRQSPVGLVLRRNQDGEYARLGVFGAETMATGYYPSIIRESSREQEAIAWLDDCEMQTVTVV